MAKVVTLLLCGIVFATLSKVTVTMAATAEPKEAKVTELMSKDLTDLAGKEGLMLLISILRVARIQYIATTHMDLFMCWKARS